MRFTDFNTCWRCAKQMGIGDKRGWCADGFVYCPECMPIRDAEMRKEVDAEQERKARKARERLKASTGNE